MRDKHEFVYCIAFRCSLSPIKFVFVINALLIFVVSVRTECNNQISCALVPKPRGNIACNVVVLLCLAQYLKYTCFRSNLTRQNKSPYI